MLATNTVSIDGTAQAPSRPLAAAVADGLGYQVVRRNGSVSPFDPNKISIALTKAFLAVEGAAAAGSRRIHDTVEELTRSVVAALTRRGESRTRTWQKPAVRPTCVPFHPTENSP